MYYYGDCIFLDKFYIIVGFSIMVNDSDRVIISWKIESNFLVNGSWYSGLKLLKMELLVKNVIFIIDKVECIDIWNIIFFVSNVVV